MKTLLFSLLICTLSFYCFAQENPSSSTIPTKLDKAQKEVWDMEHEYWNAVKDGDINAYIDLYGTDHISWPSFVPAPESREQIKARLFDFIANVKPGSTQYQLVPHEIDVRKDLAFVYYMASWSMETTNGDAMSFNEKFLHVWKKDPDGWRLKGGMSALVGGKP